MHGPTSLLALAIIAFIAVVAFGAVKLADYLWRKLRK